MRWLENRCALTRNNDGLNTLRRAKFENCFQWCFVCNGLRVQVAVLKSNVLLRMRNNLETCKKSDVSPLWSQSTRKIQARFCWWQCLGFSYTLPHEELPGFAFCPISHGGCSKHLIFFNIPPQDGSIDAANLIDAAVRTTKMIFPGAFGLLHFRHLTSAKAGRFPGHQVVMVWCIVSRPCDL